MQININTLQGNAAGNVDVSDAVFGADFKEPLIHQVLVAHMAAARSGTSAQKNRAAVAGGSNKPWRQKGTGRARAGTIRSPLFRGGGKIFPATTRNYAQKVNKKMYRGAMRSILSELLRQDRLRVIEAADLDAPKTRELVGLLKASAIDDVLIVISGELPNITLAARNLPNVDVVGVADIDPVTLLSRENVVMIGSDAMKKIEEALK